MPAAPDRMPAPPETSREIAAWNEAMVDRYDIERYYEAAHPLVRWVERHRLEALRRLAAAQPGERLLEVGCGAGHVLARFEGVTRFAIDLSSAMLARTKRRLAGQARLAQAFADGLPFASGSFDVVLCTEVLEHTADPAAVIAELMRVARPGARVIVSVPNEKNIDRAKRFIRRMPVLSRMLSTLAAEGNEWHLHDFDLTLLRRTVAGTAHIAELVAVPGRLLPVRYVARLSAAPRGGSD